MSDASTGSWLLTVEGSRPGVPWTCKILGELKGSRQDALATLWEESRRYRPNVPLRVRRRRVYRVSDGYVVRYDGMTSESVYVFKVCEQVWDSEEE